jgi:hypothetical protein
VQDWADLEVSHVSHLPFHLRPPPKVLPQHICDHQLTEIDVGDLLTPRVIPANDGCAYLLLLIAGI